MILKEMDKDYEFSEDDFHFAVNVKTGTVKIFIPKEENLRGREIFAIHLGALEFIGMTGKLLKEVLLQNKKEGENE